MKNTSKYLTVFTLFLLICSCTEQVFNDEPNIVTTEDITIDVPISPLDNYIGTVLGLSTNGITNFSIVEQSVSGAVNIDNNGNITVANPLVFDLNVNPTITAQVMVSNNGVSEISLVTLNLIFRDTDGDGIADFQETENGTDLNNPCDPLQAIDYTDFNPANEIWTAADCDGDGTLNGDEFNEGSDPYDPCIDNVNTSLWLDNVNVVDVGFGEIIRETTSSCRILTLKGDLVGYAAGDCDDADDIVTLNFEPDFDGATTGSVTIIDAVYLDVCFGFGDRIFSETPGTYDENTGIIEVGYIIYFGVFDPALIDDYFSGTFRIEML